MTTIEQQGVIATLGEQLIVVIQKRNHDAVKKLMNKKLNVKITMTAL